MTPEPPSQKADFDAIYDRPDPRAYYTTLEPLHYETPQHGCEVAVRLLDAMDRPSPTVFDVCCSYGVMGMMLKTDLDFAKLTDHYADPALADADTEQVARADRALLDEHRHPDAPRVVGLDVAAQAVGYAVGTGALDDGAVEDLESAEPSPRLRDLLGGADLVTTIGGVSYVTDTTFDRLAASTPDTAWFATFCLRTYDFTPLNETLAGHGLRTETAPGTWRQRRFRDEDEQRWAVAQARALGYETEGKEDAGCFHTELHVSRPRAEADAVPLDRLLAGLGAGR